MKKSPFYFEVKDIMTQFISAFDSVVISRYNKGRQEQDKIQVRYVYSPKQRVIHDLVNKARHITLPAIAVNISSINRDNTRVFNKIAGSYHWSKTTFGSSSALSHTSDYLPQPVPINVTVNMSILTKYQTDMDQILSNFIPYNDPYIVISWKIPEEFVRQEQEIRSEVLWSGDMALTYPTEINSSTPYRVSADTSFVIKGWLFRDKPIQPVGNIFVVNSYFTPVSSIIGLDIKEATENLTVYPPGKLE